MYPAHQVLADLLAESPRTIAELATASGYKPNTVHGAIFALRAAGYLIHSQEVRRSTKGRRARRYWTGKREEEFDARGQLSTMRSAGSTAPTDGR